MRFHAISVAGNTVKVTSGAASANTPMPTTADGTNPRYVRIATDGNVYVRPVQTAAGTASASDILVTPNDALILAVRGFGYLAYIQSAAAANVSITPIEA